MIVDREPVRRHPDGRGGGAGGLDGHAAVGVDRRARRTAHGLLGLYEPIHGSAPDIAGQDVANPIGDDPLGRDAAALVVRSRATRRRRSRRRSSVRSTPASGPRHRWPRRGRQRRWPRRSASSGTTRDDRGDPPTGSGERRGRRAVERVASARSCSTTRRSATGPSARARPLAGRQAQDRPHASTSSACPTSRAAGRARTPRTASSSRPRGRSRWRTRAAGGVRLDPPSRESAGGRPEPARRWSTPATPVVTIFGK